jgi:glycosyltransferase involved in cell wall biosynthesis
MRVLIVSSYFPSSKEGVAGIFVYEEAKRICDRNVEVHVARGLRSIRNERKNLVADGINIHNFSEGINLPFLSCGWKTFGILPIRSFFRPDSIFFTVPYSWFLLHLIKEFSIDIIHAHFAYPAGFAGLLAKKAAEKPLVVTLHGVDIITEPSINYGIRLKKAYDRMVEKVVECADKVFAASTFVYQEALNAGCEQERLVLLPNGVDMRRFNPEINGAIMAKRLGIEKQPIVFTLRAHDPKNGIEYLIRAIPQVVKEMPEVIFVIGGDGPLRTFHEALARKLNIYKSCIFVGRIPQGELPYYYSACDIFVIPSVTEAFGIVTVEAMACGRPVIGTNVGGIQDIVRDRASGFLVRPRDSNEIADRIIALIENPKLRRTMGNKGRKIAEENFDINKRIDKILSVYHDLMN